ncbi:malonyl-CoA decarboxylase [Hydrogenophaga sp. 5NK40-0174]|uniref:malonyl-CoA decarboxylase n=1 Tax=Hydrogenophaga sp. 5NK40-0174 TaxID=3127649 RepID=UPI003106D42A
MLEKLLRLTKKAMGDQTVEPLLRSCHQLVSESGQASVYTLAVEVIERYQQLPAGRREAFFAALATEFSPDADQVLEAAKRYSDSPSAQHLARLTRAVEPPRQELIRRINRAPGGTAMLLGMRNDLMHLSKANPELSVVDADFLHLLSSWFNPGFLRLEQVDWQSSAALLEKIIHHEAVHEISGWNDLRRRLQPDRRCYAFFHPQLGDEPLIFVEVALVRDMADAIAPLLENTPDPQLDDKATTAVFYSISNCQPGLRGVSLGNFLIKKVAGQLKRELPQLKTFCTLSPIPGLTKWLDATHSNDDEWRAARDRVARWRQANPTPQAEDVQGMNKNVREALQALCAHYLVDGSHAAGGDPVARFHLDNGARLERINLMADLSRKGIKQSLGLMVNYLYDIGSVETRHQQFVDRKVSHSPAVRRIRRSTAN